ncbi:hypothetical protein D3C81_1367330 [compost metagenome]
MTWTARFGYRSLNSGKAGARWIIANDADAVTRNTPAGLTVASLITASASAISASMAAQRR